MIGGFHEGLSPLKRTVILDFAFPLRDLEVKGDRRVTAHLFLPRDVTRNEVERLYKMMLTLVMDNA